MKKISKMKEYIRVSYFYELLLVNIPLFAGTLCNFNLLQIISLMLITILIGKNILQILSMIYGQKFISVFFIVKERSLFNRIEYEKYLISKVNNYIEKFCWLACKLNLHCILLLLICILIFFCIEEVFGYKNVAYLMFGNIILIVLNLKKESRDIIKNKLELPKEFSSYIIQVTVSPEKRNNSADRRLKNSDQKHHNQFSPEK